MLELAARLERLLFEGPNLPGRTAWVPFWRLLRYPYAVLRDLWRGELNLRAMGLVYTTLLSIVPLLAFAFAIFKGVGIHRDLEPLIYEFFRPVGAKANELTARVMGFVENISSGVLGSLGLAFLLYTVVSMIQKIEESLNFVWRVERPRSFARRVSEYLSLMVVGPIVVVAGLGLTATAANSALMQNLSRIEPLGTLIGYSGTLVPYALVSAFFTFLYIFIPNTRVRFVPALVGGITAGILWVSVGAAFTIFVAYATRLELVYTSFAILITALIWIYVAWLVLLIGAQLSFYVQNPQYLRRGQREIRITGSLAEQLALNVMVLIGRSYRAGEPGWTTSRIATRLEVPSNVLAMVIRSLESAGLVVATEDERLIPGRDLSEIDLNQIVDAARRHHAGEPTLFVRGTPEAERLTTVIELALRERLEGRTLREVVEADSPA
ncbi:MAG TPA: YihY/virulence factor BrkB family protein [Steroidobacteraceae bacterium]